MSSPQEFARFKIPLEDVLKATDNFSDKNIIGQGGFGKVYKGSLVWSGQQTIIAARRLHYDYGQGDFAFWQEISMLSDLKHENLVCFLGYCDEKREKIIINKHENLESLEKHLKDSNLTWTQRLHICVGVASAMNYIHFDVGRDYSVIHRNIKSSKILLDDNWKPKLSGFEHALRNTNHRRHRLLLAETIGTIGYADPTYEKTGFVNHKSDVYSLGVVLFEILCGRRAFIPDDQEQGSPQLVNLDAKNGNLDVENETQLHTSTDKVSTSKNIMTRLIDNNEDYLCTEFIRPFERSDFLEEAAPSISSGSIDRPLFSDERPLVHSFERSDLLEEAPPSISSGSIDRRPSSFVGGRPSSFVDGRPSSFNDPGTNSGSDARREVDPTSYFVRKDNFSDEGSSPSSGKIDIVKTYSSKYVDMPKQGLLAQLAKSCYDDETLDDMIDPSLLEQIDPESLQIFSETAYSCLKEQRPQRPNIDQVVRNLNRALKLQMRRENLEQPWKEHHHLTVGRCIKYLSKDAYVLIAEFLESEVIEEALAIIEELSSDQNYRSQIASSSSAFFTRLFKILDIQLIQIQTPALKILYNLTSTRNVRSLIVSSDLIPKLVTLSEDESLSRYCIAILTNLCGNQDNKSIIAETNGCISFIAKILESKSCKEQEQALEILLSLCSQSVQYCRLVMDEGVIPDLVSISINGNDNGKAKAQEMLRLLKDIHHEDYVEESNAPVYDVPEDPESVQLENKTSSKTNPNHDAVMEISSAPHQLSLSSFLTTSSHNTPRTHHCQP